MFIIGGLLVAPWLLPSLEALEKDLPQYETDSQILIWDNQIKIWITLVQAVGGAMVLLGVWFTWRNLRATQAKLDIDREGQITNHFTQAIGQLGAELKDGDPNLEVRLGGICALERIARDSPRDHWTIMEVLTAYVRRNAPWRPVPPATAGGTAGAGEPQPPPKPRTDIQAILTVLGRRIPPEESPEPARLDLRGTDLRGAALKGAHLEGAALTGAHLEGAALWGAHLEGASLWGAHLEGASLWEAHLEGAALWEAHLEGASLWGAHLEEASLWRVHLEGASLSEAHLEGAVLSGVTGLTRGQVESAHNAGKGALLPSYLQAPAEPPPSEPSPTSAPTPPPAAAGDEAADRADGPAD
jgi:hypothetical protein